MKRLPLTAQSLAAWRNRDSITSGQAAYLLAGLEPVNNPSPSLPPNAKAAYSHLLNAISYGELPAQELTRRIEPDVDWLNSLSLEEYTKWGFKWEKISNIDLKQDNGKYRFKIEAHLFFAWADAGGWFKNTQPKAPNKPLNGFNIIALRLAIAGGAPATREKFFEAMDSYGVKRVSKNILDAALKDAKDTSKNLSFSPHWSGQAPSTKKRLFECAYLHNTLKNQWTNADLNSAKKAWQKACDDECLIDLLSESLNKQKIKPALTNEDWQVLALGLQ